MPTTLPRRTFLKGLGTAIALPYLEAMTPPLSAAPTETTKVSTAANGLPIRTAFVYVPNGAHMPDWTPNEVGKLGTKLPWILEPLAPFKDDLNILSGLALDKARSNGDGPGDHARAMAAFLTGRQPRKTAGADIRAGQSADQWIASQIGDNTLFPSLELGIERGQQAGSCDSGYSCAYSSNLSWRSESTPNAKEVDPALVFDRLFGGQNAKEVAEARARRDMFNKSILDFVREDANQLRKRLGATDQRKMEEYLTSVREIEHRIQRLKQQQASKKSFTPNLPKPTGIPRDLAEHIQLMCDLMVLAFQGDLTRVVTFPFGNDGSNRPYPFIGVSEGHHDCSHHGRDPKKQEKIRIINRFHITMLTYLLNKLKNTKENGQSLLDQTVIVYGSGIGDGDRHNHDDLPILTIGKAGGTLETGRHLKYAFNTPLMNLYLAIFQRVGAPTRSFGDSTGVLSL